MIGFVLDAPGEHARDFLVIQFAGQVVRLHGHDFWPNHGGVQPRQAQAAFLLLGLALVLAQHRVDEHHLLILGRRVAFQVDDEQPVRQVHLVRGQADALGLVHQVEHFGDHPPQFGVNPLERA